MTYKIGCVLMASGNSSRFGENKLNKTIKDKTLIERALLCITTNKLSKIVVVSQYDEVKAMALNLGFHFIKNEHPDYGISYTIKLGLDYTKDCDATMFMVSDQPLLRKESVADMLDFFTKNRDFIVGMGYNGKRGNPCVFPSTYYDELNLLNEDNGGNTVIRAHEKRLKIFEASHPDELSDIDTKEDLIKLSNTEV